MNMHVNTADNLPSDFELSEFLQHANSIELAHVVQDFFECEMHLKALAKLVNADHRDPKKVNELCDALCEFAREQIAENGYKSHHSLNLILGEI